MAKREFEFEDWFIENLGDFYCQGFKIIGRLEREKTPYQTLEIYETERVGKLMVLDGCVMLTEAHEFAYHELLVHVPLSVHPRPESVLVIGGGDGGTIRETLKHKSVRRAVQCEIDEAVTRSSQKYFPQLTEWIGNDERAELVFDDGIKYIKEHRGEFDVILVDSTDPIGPAVGLFTSEFYSSVSEALKPEGILTCQGESPWHMINEVVSLLGELNKAYDHLGYYIGHVPCYPGATWGFGIASNARHNFEKPLNPALAEEISRDCKYYTPQIHAASFALPKFVNELIKGITK